MELSSGNSVNGLNIINYFPKKVRAHFHLTLMLQLLHKEMEILDFYITPYVLIRVSLILKHIYRVVIHKSPTLIKGV